MRVIDADELYRVKFHGYPDIEITPSDVNAEAYKRGWNDAIDAVVECAPTTDAVEVVRCKDCVYKPYVVDVFHASYGDVPVLESDKCPCVNKDDYFYSHMPDDDWFCANGERRTEE